MKHIFAFIGLRKGNPSAANDHDDLKKVRRRSDRCDYYDAEIYGELKQIPNLHGFFASSSGHIFKNDRLLKGHAGRKGYRRVTIRNDGCNKNYYVHTLIALVWHGDRPEGFHVDHVDFDKLNNRPENLRYLSAVENSIRRRKRKAAQ